MEFSNEQKLIITLLTDIHRQLAITGGLDPSFVDKATEPGKEWMLDWKYNGLFRGETTPPEVLWVLDALQMWEEIERTSAGFDPAQQAELETLSKWTTTKFPGFDGNNEDEYGIASDLINDLGRFTIFAGHDLNSHMPMKEIYGRMLVPYRALGGNHNRGRLTVQQLAGVLKEAIHPENR